MAIKIPNKDFKLLLAITGALIALIILTLTVFNPPQCPEFYTQSQIDASNCIVGANIGLGLTLGIIIFPLTLFVMALWILALDRAMAKRPDIKVKKSKK